MKPAAALARSAIALLLALPFVPLVLWSLAGTWFYPDLLPTWSARAWEAIAAPRSLLLRSALASLSIAAMVTALALAIGTPAAYALARGDFRGKRAVETLVLAPLLVPPFAIAFGLTLELLTLQKLGLPLYRTTTGVVLAHLIPTLPYVVRLGQSSFATQGAELDHAAATLGATPARVFWHVALPAARPTLLVAGLFAFMISLSTYLLTFLVGGGLIVTLPTLLFGQISNLDRAAASVTAIILILPGIVYLLAAERLLRRSRTTIELPVT